MTRKGGSEWQEKMNRRKTGKDGVDEGTSSLDDFQDILDSLVALVEDANEHSVGGLVI